MKIIRCKTKLLALVTLFTALMWAPGLIAAPSDSYSTSVDDSDLNKDGIISFDDLTLFSSRYLGEDAGNVDWCAFINAINLEDKLYGKQTTYFTKRYSVLFTYASDYFGCVESSNMDGDVQIDARDLMAFSEQYAGEHFMLVDWCVFMEAILAGEDQFGQTADYFLSHYGLLMIYIQENYECSDGPGPGNPLTLKNSPRFLTRIAAARNADGDYTGDYYVTDAKVDSVFYYDSDLVRTKELKGLAAPLGIAVNSQGHILVGNDKRDNVEVYDPANGVLLAAFGESEIETPSSILLDSQGSVYVTDTGSNTVYVYDSQYNLVKNIGERGRDAYQLRSPSSTWLSLDESELYVLDRLNRRIQVFDDQGSWQRSITFEGTDGENCNWFTGICAIPGLPPFTRLQSMDIDDAGMLHVLDIFLATVFIMNPQNGEYVGSYGSFGHDSGELKTPTSLLVEADRTLVVDGGKNTIEILALP